VNAKEMTIEAAKHKYAVGAFNITSLIQLEGVVDAAVEHKSPVIIQTSAKPTKFLGAEVLVGICRTIAESAPIPICLQLDHCMETAYCKKCADLGYSSVMIDASRQPFESNISQTKEVTDYCHKFGNTSVEGGLGTVDSVKDQLQAAETQTLLTIPEQAMQYVAATGVDLLAPAIGTAHGIYRKKNPKIDFERLGKINELLNGSAIRTPLVVHGGTGLPENHIQNLIEMGGAKFNISTELKHTLIDATYKYISGNREEYEPGKVDIAVRDAIRKSVGHWMHMLGSVGKA
jgi:tagatose 1,6-diphosphate aldolase GatY/KbaY